MLIEAALPISLQKREAPMIGREPKLGHGYGESSKLLDLSQVSEHFVERLQSGHRSHRIEWRVALR